MIYGRYVECTSSVIQSLNLFMKSNPAHRQNENDLHFKSCWLYWKSPASWWLMVRVHFTYHISLQTTVYILLDIYLRYGSRGTCFTNAIWYGISGLVAAGRSYQTSYHIRKVCEFLMSKQLESGLFLARTNYKSSRKIPLNVYRNKYYSNLLLSCFFFPDILTMLVIWYVMQVKINL